MRTDLIFVETPRLRFACRTWGASDGIPLLLLHGSYGSSRWWERLSPFLPEEIYAIAPDLRGCGQTDKTEQGYFVEEQAQDLAALVDALGWHDYHLMAHSSSGAIAMEYAFNERRALNTLTLVNTAPIEGIYTPIDTYMVLEAMRTDRDLLHKAILALMPSIPLVGDEANREYVELLVDDAAQMAPAAFTEVARGLAQWNRFADASQLTLPTLLVWGENDTIVDRDVTTRTLIALPGANNLEVLRGVGHSPMIEAPAVLADRWVDFILEDFAGYGAVRNSAYADDQVSGME